MSENDDPTEFDDAADPETLEGEPETEWVGEDEWGDEEEEDVAVVEEEVPNFIDNGDGTISDTLSSLMWKKDDSYKEFNYGITWFEAHDYCEMLNDKKFAGFDDWRLPSGEEAKSLFRLFSRTRIRLGPKFMFQICLSRVVVIIPGPMKKNRTTSNMRKNSVM